jgi:WD40 repeat protein
MSIAFDASGERAAAVGFDESVVVWDVTARGRGEVATWPARGPAVFGPHGAQIASVDASGTDVMLMSTEDWQTQHTIVDVGGISEDPATVPEGSGLVTALVFDPQGASLATAVPDTPTSFGVAPYREVALWDPTTGIRLATLGWYWYPPGRMDFSNDGSRLSITTRAGTPVRIWNTHTETFDLTMPELPEPGRIGLSAALSPDGDLVAVQTSMKTEPNVQLWTVDPAEKIAEAEHRAFLRGGLDFSPDGTSLVTGGADGVVRLWQVPGLEPVLTMEGHTGPIQDAVYTADGTRIATSSEDGTFRLWDAQSGELQVTLSGHDGFADIDVSTDGRYLVTADGTTARVWALDLDELVGMAESRLTRSLTEAECVSYHFETCPTRDGPD